MLVLPAIPNDISDVFWVNLRPVAALMLLFVPPKLNEGSFDRLARPFGVFCEVMRGETSGVCSSFSSESFFGPNMGKEWREPVFRRNFEDGCVAAVVKGRAAGSASSAVRGPSSL